MQEREKESQQEKRHPVVMTRLSHRKDDLSSFDLEFWRKVGAQGRFAAAWQMVLDLHHWKKNYEPQSRLQRSFEVLKRRPG